MIASWPENETERLANLTEYPILDTASEPQFDECVLLATKLAEVPIGIIVIVDKHRGWYKARTGTSLSGSTRDIAFCSHAILSHEPMLVEDATFDVRFSDHPLVIRGPGIRFYAGFPIISPEDYVLGTLCVLDHFLKKLTEPQILGLQELAARVMKLIEKTRPQRRA